MTQPDTRYAAVGDERVAYQVFGQGSRDLIATAGQVGHLDLDWEDPATARFHRRLASFARLIRFDPRGTGLSDPRPSDGGEAWQHWSEDLSAVLDACGSQSAAILAWLDGGTLALHFAAAFPDRVRALVLMNGVARYSAAPDYPEGSPPEALDRFLKFTRQHYGTERWARAANPSLVGDDRTLRWYAKYLRAMASPKASAEIFANQQKLDVRSILPRIRVPTLVMVRRDSRWVPSAQSRYVAQHVPGARFLILPGGDIQPFWETPDLILDHIEEFLTGVQHGGEPERALVALLFCDIVGSTARAAQLGDAAWRALLDRHDHVLREQVGLFAGKVVNQAGDGSLSTFENPRRAIECALALQDAWRDLGIESRIGIHFGEVERREEGEVGGVSVHLGARVMAAANADEVLVSRTLRDILIGSRYEFADRGTHDLKGVPERWQLYSLVRS
jgi:pimeloyl-ACP methyl ester carboxylesterase